MTIKFRFTLLLGMLLGTFLLALVLVRNFEQSGRASLLAADRQARATLLNHWIDAANRELPNFAADLAQSEELTALLATSDQTATRTLIAASLTKVNAAALWIVSGDSVTKVRAFPQKDAPAPPLPLEPGEFTALVTETASPRFFAEASGVLLEICVRRLRAAGSYDWLVVARRWDDAHLRTLSSLTESVVTLRNPREATHLPPPESKLVLVRTLNDWRGRAIRVLRIDCDLPDANSSLGSSMTQAHWFIAFGLLVLAAMALALNSWVLRPLRTIRESLAADDGADVMHLSKEPTELGGIARLVLTSLAQKGALRAEVEVRKRAQEALATSEAELRQNVEDRARLGRDLHDGVIQSLYAAGMGLAGIRAQLRPDQTEAAARLEQTRAALNETIHDVRNSIVGLEPEALKSQTFSQAVSALLASMQSMRAFRSSVRLNDELAARLSLSQRVHALQIAREAVSNALRHGEASLIEVTLRQHDDVADFEVADDGRGFDATSQGIQGRGLANFSQRARELGAELDVHSQPGRGTRVRVTFSLLP